jgi:5'(3')-deoxyribonucleotidase
MTKENCCGNWDSEGKCTCEKPKQEGLRFNEGKTRYDLVPAFAQEQYAKVLTVGANKYAERNWELGMKWSKVIASLERHIQAIKRGEDFDPEDGLLHSAHAMCNAAFLTEYYKIYPQGDDRPHKYLRNQKIGLDIDEVLCDFVGGCIDRFPDMKDRSVYWNDPHIALNWKSIIDDEAFWLNLKSRVNHDDLGFEPHCYITSRSIPTELTKKWLDLNGFPSVPIYTVGHNESKVEIAKKSGIDIFVDDRFENFVELNNAGICCYLFDAPHNKRYDVGHKRIYSLKELSI